MASNDQAPAEPMTPTAEAMAQMHEFYTGMRTAGFTMLEACTVIGSMIAHSIASGQEDSQP